MPAMRTVEPSAQATCVVPADLPALLPFRDALAAALNEHGWEQDHASRVLICAVEGMANAVAHGSPAGGRVALAFTFTAARTDIRVTDQGVGAGDLPPLEPDVPALERQNGRGLLLILGLCDRLEVECRGSGTEVRLAFSRNTPASQELPWAA
jgi:anti-sigma regulatory factor (Ser/Thr protein kinase)